MRISDWSSDVCSSDLHDGFARNAERERDARLGRDDPETDLADLFRHGAKPLFGEVARDHRAEDRLEAGFQLLRQGGDLLRHIIDAVDRRRGELAEDVEIEEIGRALVLTPVPNAHLVCRFLLDTINFLSSYPLLI